MSSSDSHSLPPVAEAQPLQPGSWSMQVTVHTPQVLGHSFMTARGLRSHSPLAAHAEHCLPSFAASVRMSKVTSTVDEERSRSVWVWA